MIKKIDANEYGVVRYAITSVDELNRLPKKIAPSSQAILIENGLRVFVYGDGQWVEEVVDGDLSENMQSIVADYERSKIGYDGVKRGSLEERLKDDFQGIYDILNARDYCEYSGKELKVDNTWMGNQIDTRIEGRTLQNIVKSYEPSEFKLAYPASISEGVFTLPEGKDINNMYVRALASNHLYKPDTIYTVFVDILENTTGKKLGMSNLHSMISDKFERQFQNLTGVSCIRFTTTTNGLTTKGYEPSLGIYFGIWSANDTSGEFSKYIKFKYWILEGDHTQTPLSELPYLEGIESVGEREIGKNLLDPSELEYGSIEDGAEANKEGYITNRKRSGFMKVKPNTNYVFSSNLDEPFTNWWFYDINKKYVSKEAYCRTITTPSNCEYMRVHNGHTDGTPLSDFKLQIEEGTVATEYEPFGYIIKGKSCGKNLLNINSSENIVDSVEAIIDGNTLTVTQTAEGSWRYYGVKLNNLKPNTTYTCSATIIGDSPCRVRIFDVKTYKEIIHFNSNNGKVSFTPTINLDSIWAFFYTSYNKTMPVGTVAIFKDIILEEGTTATPYEPYQESTYSIHSPIPLRSLPNGVCDVYDFESGAVIQRVGKVVLDGSEEFNLENTTSEIPYFNYTSTEVKKLSNNAETGALYCDRFIPTTVKHTYNGLIEGVSQGGNGNYIQIAINKNKLSTIDNKGLSDWLQANPTTVYYELEEPIIHYLTPSQLKSFDGTTHVISENTLIPTTTTKILTDTYANVSNVNSTAYSLRRGVNDVAESSAIINETDVEQDDVLDVTMCAIDELYSMLEPNLE